MKIKLAFFLAIFYLTTKVEGRFENDLENVCCEQIGRKQAEIKSTCERIIVSKSIGNGTITDHRYCQQLASICCYESLEKKHCKSGVEYASSQMIKSHNSAFEHVTCNDRNTSIERHCCNICGLAILNMERSNNARCSTNNFPKYMRMNHLFNHTLQACCQRIQTKINNFLENNSNLTKIIHKKSHRFCDSHTCGVYQTCVNSPQGPRCICHSGFQMDEKTGECRDVNECLLGTHDCPPYLRCDNTLGSYECVRVIGCGYGYTIDADTDECEDIDECLLDDDRCSSDSVCKNTVGSYYCEKIKCQSGEVIVNRTCVSRCSSNQVWNSKHQICFPKYPCENSLCQHECYPSERMISKNRFYECSCRAGFQLDERDSFTCVDVDECKNEKYTCPQKQMCSNTHGSFTCVCPPGFERLSINSPCTDINECHMSFVNTCPQSTNCINTLGDHQCVSIDCPQNYHKKSTENSILCSKNDSQNYTLSNQNILSQSYFLYDKISHLYYSFLSNQTSFPISFYAHRFTGLSMVSNEVAEIPNVPKFSTANQKVHFSLKFRDSSCGLKDFHNYFGLRHPRSNEAIVSMLKSISGPCFIKLEMIVSGYRKIKLFRHQVLLNIYISKYALNRSQHFIV